MSIFKNKLLSAYFILVLVFSFVGCSQREKLEEITFDDTVELKEEDSLKKSEINICVGSMITPEEGYAYYKKLLDYMGKKLDMRVNFVEKRTYSEVNSLLQKESIDVAFVCGGPYVVAQDEFGLELLVAPLVDGNTVYYSYVIVADNSEIEKFEELRNKVFAFVDPMSNTGKLIPAYMLHELGETPGSFFKEWSYTYSHDNSIKAVAQGIVDAAAVDSLIWEYLDKKGSKYAKGTKVIEVSKPYGIPPVVVRPGLENGLKLRIKGVLLNMHADAEGKHILEGMFIERFIEIDDSSYDTIREIRARVKD